MNSQEVPSRAMFIVAHPDDIEFVAGGTAALWAQQGCELIYVLVTDGNVGTHQPGMTADRLIRTRRSEQQAAANITGAKECIFLGYHDGLLEASPQLRKDLVRLIRKYRPEAVVAPDPSALFVREDYINHPDHRAVAVAAMDAVFPAAEMRLLYPDLEAKGLKPHRVSCVYIYTGVGANYYVDITSVMDLKLKALLQHASQFVAGSPEERVRARAQNIGSTVGFPYAECFRRIILNAPEDAGRPGRAFGAAVHSEAGL